MSVLCVLHISTAEYFFNLIFYFRMGRLFLYYSLLSCSFFKDRCPAFIPTIHLYTYLYQWPLNSFGKCPRSGLRELTDKFPQINISQFSEVTTACWLLEKNRRLLTQAPNTNTATTTITPLPIKKSDKKFIVPQVQSNIICYRNMVSLLRNLKHIQFIMRWKSLKAFPCKCFESQTY